MHETSVGRVITNEAIPKEVGYINELLSKKVAARYHWQGDQDLWCGPHGTISRRHQGSGLHHGLQGRTLVQPGRCNHSGREGTLIQEGYAEVEQIMENYNMGFITYNERYNQIIDTWTHINSKLSNILMKQLSEDDRDSIRYT